MDFGRYLPIMYPQALCLGLVLAWLYARRLGNRNIWRLSALVMAILVLCYPVLRLGSKAFDLVILVDQSRSISEESRKQQVELIGLAERNLKAGDRIGIVSFNERGYIEQAPQTQGSLSSFNIPFSEDASDLTDGLRTAISLVGPSRRGRVWVLSDGEYTGADPIREAQLANQRKIPIYYRDLKSAEFFNLSMRDVETPGKILANEPFQIVFKVDSTVATPGRYRLYRNDRIVGEEQSQGWRTYDFKVGQNRIVFTDNLKTPAIHAYRLEVQAEPRESETVLKDNIAERFVKVVGERPLLLVNTTGQPDNVSRILSAGALDVHLVGIKDYRMGINQLEGYKGIILNNVALLNLPLQRIEDMRTFVENEGGGLVVCGGNQSFAKGGYYMSPLDSILPVSLEDRQQSKKVSTAFSIVMDRSGSMGMTVPSGQTKMQLANTAVAECINLMSEVDSISVIPVDSMAHIAVAQQNVINASAIISDVRRIEAGGGGIFVYTGLRAAADEIVKASQTNKHILLFADAADSEEPGEYIKLLESLTKAGVTVSVVGLGTEQDSDAEFIKDVAKRGNGSIYFTNDANQLAQFFTADTITYTRNSFIEDPVPMVVRRTAATALAPENDWKNFTAGSYNLLFARPKSNIAIQTADDDQAPILAFWQRGLGRVVSLACDTGGDFSARLNYGDIMLSSARWAMGSNVQDSFQVHVTYEGNYARIRLEVSDEQREQIGMPRAIIRTPKGEVLSKPLQWDTHNTLSTELRLDELGCWRGAIDLGGGEALKIDPISMPVSPEFLRTRNPDFGKETLQNLAQATGGKKILDVRNLFERTTSTYAQRPVILPFLIVLLCLFLIDIAEARFGLQAILVAQYNHARLRARTLYQQMRTGKRTSKAPQKKRPRSQSTEPARKTSAWKASQADTEALNALDPDRQPEVEEPEQEKEVETKDSNDMDFLVRTKQRANQRFKKR